jgi:preprotein translocase subunit SecD
MQELRWKIVLILAITAMFAFLAFSRPVKYGLDLSGGIHLVLNVVVDDAVRAEVRDDMDGFQRLLGDEGIAVSETTPDGVSAAVLTVSSSADVDRAIDLAEEYWQTYDAGRAGENRLRMRLTSQSIDAARDGAVRQALQTIRNRIDEYGVNEPIIQRQGLSGSRILVQLPGVESPERVKALLRNTALLELRLVQAGPAQTRQELANALGELPSGTEILAADSNAAPGDMYYLVDQVPVVTGRDLKTARLGQDQLGLPSVNFTLDAEGGRKFADFTGANVGRQLAVVLDDRVRTAPVIEERIPGNGQIRGEYTLEEAEDLALVLRSGALPASIQYLEERSVGPALGRESIERGISAALVGMAIVVVFMLLYYKGAGINAVIALALNLIIVIGTMNALGASLTLPGIAGMILLIGMAVDANVLIFERIREELDLGKTVRSAVDTGFAKAFSTIIDANITTLVAAVFLFQFGTGPVKGFAVTLTIGIVASMFTAIFVSRVMFDLWVRRRSSSLSI